MKKFLVYKKSYTDLKLISGNIGKLYEEGISFVDIFELIQEMPLKARYKVAIKDIEKSLKEGKSFEDSLKEKKELFPTLFISLVSIGEKTGRLALVLKSLEKYYGKREMMRKNILKSLSYPCILFIALICVFFLLVFMVIPNIGEMYLSLDKDIPKSCMVLMNFKQFVKEQPWILPLGIGVVAILFKLSIMLIKKRVKMLSILQQIPLVRDFNEYLIIILLSIVINSGINISKGFSYCSELKYIGNVGEKLKSINKGLLQGEELSTIMKKSKLFSKYTLAHIKLGEYSGSLDTRLELLEGELYENMIFKLNKNMEKIQPCLIVMMASLVLIFISTFIMPLLDGFNVGGI